MPILYKKGLQSEERRPLRKEKLGDRDAAQSDRGMCAFEYIYTHYKGIINILKEKRALTS